MHPSLEPFQGLVDLHNRLFLNCLDDVEEDKWTRRIGEEVGSMAFMACHLVEARYFLSHLMGGLAVSGIKEKLDALEAAGSEEAPGIDEVRAAWKTSADVMAAGLAGMDETALAKPSGQPFPMADESLLGAISFLIHHEAYHIGQMGLLRRALGLDAMKYGG